MYIRSLVVASIALVVVLYLIIADEQSIGLEEVVVTARKQENRLRISDCADRVNVRTPE